MDQAALKAWSIQLSVCVGGKVLRGRSLLHNPLVTVSTRVETGESGLLILFCYSTLLTVCCGDPRFRRVYARVLNWFDEDWCVLPCMLVYKERSHYVLRPPSGWGSRMTDRVSFVATVVPFHVMRWCRFIACLLPLSLFSPLSRIIWWFRFTSFITCCCRLMMD